MNTPPRVFKAILVSDFQYTQSLQKLDTLEKTSNTQTLDHLPTPKKLTMFSPLKDRLLPRNEFKTIKNNRARLMDWFLQIFSAYKLGWECFWMSVQLLDSLIGEFQYVNLRNIHLVGMVCCFIMAKYLGLPGLTMNHVVAGLGHYKFNERDIIMEQQQIVSIIFSKSNFQRNNIYSYLMEKYIDLPVEKLSEAMKLLTLAMMRPDISFDSMKVTTYKELVDRIIMNVAYDKRISILEFIETDMANRFGSSNVSKFALKLSFI